MKELWWEDKDIVSLMIKLISKKLSVQDFKNSHIYLTALSGLLSDCTIQTSPSQWGDLLVFTTIFSFIHWFFSIITALWWSHHDVMTSLCLCFSSSVRLAFQCCCAAVFTTLLFTAQQLFLCNFSSTTLFSSCIHQVLHCWYLLVLLLFVYLLNTFTQLLLCLQERWLSFLFNSA